MHSFDELNEMLDMTTILISCLQPILGQLIGACMPEIYAVDWANELIKQGMSFREAYYQDKWKETGKMRLIRHKISSEKNVFGFNW